MTPESDMINGITVVQNNSPAKSEHQ